MNGKPNVTMDGEWLLAQIQQLEYILDEIRSVAAGGAFVKPEEDNSFITDNRGRVFGRGAPPRQAPSVNVLDIPWLKKGSEPASPGDPWAWAFAFDMDGQVLPETEELLEALERDGKVQIDGYEISLGGHDKNLLNRKKLKVGGGRR